MRKIEVSWELKRIVYFGNLLYVMCGAGMGYAHIWVHTSVYKRRPKEDACCPDLVFSFNSVEAGSLAEPGARLATITCPWSSCLHH